jgi:hypothetical protein
MHEHTIPIVNLHLPMGGDIAKLLLLCAPPNALKQLDLSDDNEGEFAHHFNSLNDYFKHRMIALALYYAGRTIIHFNKSYSLVKTLLITPEVVHSLIQLVNTESFSETEGLLTEIAKDKKSKNAKVSINARHDKPGGSRDLKKQINDIWDTGKYTKKDICAEEEYQALGYKTFGTARRALCKQKIDS